ncbi:MAG: patatin-like phospholipase family protein [Candidatus Omnitrophica bacterium]|nr:patatin-like phospholipase family protein [Candidatus Omnitrophota bacterium]
MEFFKKKKKVGLVLGSGAARGLAHIGVIKALKEGNVHVDMIAGTSIGALVGACYAKKGEIADFEEVVLKTDWKQLLQLADLNLAVMFKGFVQGQKVKELLKTIIGDIEFKDLKIPLAVVATDVNTGEEVIIEKGSVAEAVRASISIPVVFMPTKFKDKFLVDGGIVNPVPVDVIKKMGATSIIVCNVIQSLSERKAAKKQKNLKTKETKVVGEKIVSDKSVLFTALDNQINSIIRENSGKMEKFQKVVNDLKRKIPGIPQDVDANTPNIFDVLVQVLYAMEYEIVKLKAQEADIMIEPDIGNIATLEFYRGEEAILEGYKAAREALLVGGKGGRPRN